MVNEVIISGRITKDLELKETSNGKILPFDVAVQREYKNKNGEYDSDFISCLANNKYGTAEFLAKHAKKGYYVSLTGRMQNNNYTRKDGTTNYGMQMIVKSVDNQTLFLNKNDNSSNDYEPNNIPSEPNVQRGEPQNEWQRENKTSNSKIPKDNPFSNANMPVDLSDDDLPF